MANGIVSLFDNIWQTIKGGFLKSWNWIVGKLNKIPGVDIKLSPVVNPVNPEVAGGVMPPVMQNNYAGNIQQSLTANTLSTGGQLKGVDRGGISSTISKNSKAVTDNSKTIGEVHFHTKEALSPAQLMEWQELN
ncbi:phage tail tape measure, TP901 family, core region domain protein [Candidatus Erwinia dacicola]|uniref:Phage tail tape measure, TP901 family, core region domain protein n=1 Tax=Candidatus Erwinia dacicola TaxID=252393 RepID=A0A328TQJ3_9GAMM|nr:phage tail tape measure, TP901 family, core region domain protein [Candidatus Erwinia dacicola]